MGFIRLETFINADPKTVFDLARNIDLHQISTKHTNEKAIAGKVSGLIELNETVTWQAKHFGVTQELTSRITEFDDGKYFVDEMENGIFKSIRHEHHFESVDGGTLMTDIFHYAAPLGVLGKLAEVLFLNKYLENLLIVRNGVIKGYAEKDLNNRY